MKTRCRDNGSANNSGIGRNTFVHYCLRYRFAANGAAGSMGLRITGDDSQFAVTQRDGPLTADIEVAQRA